jgi:hypothetical protein
MSICATNWAWSLQDITSTEKLILLSYADRAGESMEAWPSKKRLERDTCLCFNAVDKGLKSLVKKGYLVKTGEVKKQVPVYRLIGVKAREDSPKMPNKKTPPPNISPPNNGGSPPPKYGPPTPPKYGIQNHKKNHQENPKSETPSFSSFSDFKTFVTDLVASTGKQPIEVLIEEVIFYADKFKTKRDMSESVKMAIPLIKSGLWKTPHGFKGFSSKAVKQNDEEQEKLKQIQIQQDAKIGRALNKAVKTGNRQSLAEMLKDLQNANQGTMPA